MSGQWLPPTERWDDCSTSGALRLGDLLTMAILVRRSTVAVVATQHAAASALVFLAARTLDAWEALGAGYDPSPGDDAGAKFLELVQLLRTHTERGKARGEIEEVEALIYSWPHELRPRVFVSGADCYAHTLRLSKPPDMTMCDERWALVFDGLAPEIRCARGDLARVLEVYDAYFYRPGSN